MKNYGVTMGNNYRSGLIWGAAAALAISAPTLVNQMRELRVIDTPYTVSSISELTPMIEAAEPNYTADMCLEGIVGHDNHDERIQHWVAHYYDQLADHFPDLEHVNSDDPFYHAMYKNHLSRIVKSMVYEETREHPEANEHDPMQIANEGDHGLNVLQNDGIYEMLGVANMAGEFAKSKHTPRINGTWDYGGDSVMDSDRSIRGGVLFLLYKLFHYEEIDVREDAQVNYTVLRGDNPSTIAMNSGSTVKIILEDTGIDARKLKIGQTLSFSKGRKGFAITHADTLKQAVEEYNGGGDPTYKKDVFSRIDH